MKLLIALLVFMSTIVVNQDVKAQTRGPRYNPERGSRGPSTPPPSRSGRPSPAPRAPHYNPNPTRGTSTPSTPRPGGTYTPRRPSTGTVTRGSTPRGPRYNPNPARRGPVVTRPTPSTPSSRAPGYRYNRPVRVHYGTRQYHRPFGYTPIRYVNYYHAPYTTPYLHTIRYYRSYDWYSYVWRINPNYIYASWIFYPATGYNNGYWRIDNYPYYVYNGYRYRYSSYDYCNYQLVDKYDHRVTRTYWNQLCNTGYDACSYERDRLNAQMGEHRYFCSETWRNHGFDYSRPSYDETYYPDHSNDYNNTCVDANRDGMCDDFYGSSNTCSDHNRDGYCDA